MPTVCNALYQHQKGIKEQFNSVQAYSLQFETIMYFSKYSLILTMKQDNYHDMVVLSFSKTNSIFEDNISG